MNIDIEDEEREKKFLWISKNDTTSVSGIFSLYFFVAMHLQNINKRGKLDKGLISSLK